MSDDLTVILPADEIVSVTIVEETAVMVILPETGEPGLRGPPGQSADQSYLHSQVASSNVWVINHNLGYRPSVFITDNGGAQIVGGPLHISDNQTNIYFTIPTSGQARLN